jgi:Tol biopolymer transport system component
VTETLRVMHLPGARITAAARLKNTTLEPTGVLFAGVTISPDGSKIFTQRIGTNGGLFDAIIYKTDGSRPMRLGRFFVFGDAAWDPHDSGKLVFVGNRNLDGSGFGLILYHGGVARPFKAEGRRPGVTAGSVAWSLDGKSLVFGATSRTDGSYVSDLWVIGADGSGLRLLAKSAASPSWGLVAKP